MDAYKARQVLVLGTEAVADPCTYQRTRFGEDAQTKLVGGAGVLRVIGVHATHQADIDRDGRKVWHKFVDHHPQLPA
jgi:hypothetical protein